jgi:hypothetical protein
MVPLAEGAERGRGMRQPAWRFASSRSIAPYHGVAPVLRQLLHGTIALLLWVVFVLYWMIVFRRPMSADTKTSLATLGFLALTGILFLIFWIYHNVRIHKTYRRRKRRRETAFPVDRDCLGRSIVYEGIGMLLNACYIEVEVRRVEEGEAPVEEKIFWAPGGHGV